MLTCTPSSAATKSSFYKDTKSKEVMGDLKKSTVLSSFGSIKKSIFQRAIFPFLWPTAILILSLLIDIAVTPS